jgi:hypothetical protein
VLSPVATERQHPVRRTVFPDFELELLEDRHHFDPPHRIEPSVFADSLPQDGRRLDASG